MVRQGLSSAELGEETDLGARDELARLGDAVTL